MLSFQSSRMIARSCKLVPLLLLTLVSTTLSVQDPEHEPEEDGGSHDGVTEVVPGLSKY